MVQEMIPKLRVKVIDTLNVSMCRGWMAIEAARAAIEGKSLSDIGPGQADDPRCPNDPDGRHAQVLAHGGPNGKAKHLVGSMLNIKLCLACRTG